MPVINQLTLRVPYGQPLSYQQLDDNLTYLLTNMSGSNVSITGSNVNIKSSTWSINPTNFTWYGQSVTIGSNSFGTGIQTSGTLTQLGDIQGGNNSTLFTVDDGNSIVKSNVGLVITGSLRVNGFISASGQLNVGSLSSYVPNNILGTTFIGFNAFSTAGTILTVGIPTNSPFFTFGYNTSINSGGIMQVTGSLNVTGSATINNILTLAVQSSTPASGFTTGSFIVSGSGANVHAYFYNGTAWKQLDN
jgi:hypothetical protein